jgi:hypothetical protein
MNLTPTLTSPVDVFEKLVREGSRSVQTINQLAQSDYFYNFCITSLSLRDHMYEYKEVFKNKNNKEIQNKKKKCMEKWGKPNYVKAADDIANGMKHFVLRNPRTYEKRELETRRVIDEPATLTFIGVDGTRKSYDTRSFEVQLDNGEKFGMFEFITSILMYWQNVLLKEGITLKNKYDSNRLPPAIW